MRIAELSRTGGVSTATIKYYIREGLLPPGLLTSSNQARYTQDHVHRIRLIRALVHPGGLSIATIRSVVSTLDDPGEAFVPQAATVRAASARTPGSCAPGPRSAAEVRGLAERRGWAAAAVEGPEFTAIVEVLDTLRDLGQGDFADRLDDYAHIAEQAVRIDEEVLRACADSRSRAEGLIVAAVLGDVLVSALRRLARSGRSTTSSVLSASGPGGEDSC
ncbi:MerR family transcriptional regulator [Streptomyces sp. SID2131]|nr:MerR family transcriptional regulator [Streptomyces sp. SID2131]